MCSVRLLMLTDSGISIPKKKQVELCSVFVFGLVEAGRVLKTLWKHHKSKDHNFLHRSYIPNFFQLWKKIFFLWLKKNHFFSESIFFRTPKKIWVKNFRGQHFQKFWLRKNQNFQLLPKVTRTGSKILKTTFTPCLGKY